MTYHVAIQPAKEIGSPINIHTIPNHPRGSETVADIAQKAYELGRKHQAEIIRSRAKLFAM